MFTGLEKQGRGSPAKAGLSATTSGILRCVNDDLTRTHASEIRRIARQHGAVRIRVFGSQATGVSKSSSDFDFLVKLEPERDLLDLVGLKQDLETLLGRPVDIAEEEGLSPYMRERILREARSL